MIRYFLVRHWKERVLWIEKSITWVSSFIARVIDDHQQEKNKKEIYVLYFYLFLSLHR